MIAVAQTAPSLVPSPKAGAPRATNPVLTDGDRQFLRFRGTTLIDLAELAQIRESRTEELATETGGRSIRLNLFERPEFDGIVERTVATSGGFALSGSGSSGGRFTIVVNGDAVAGDLRGPQGVYRLLGRGGRVRVDQIDPTLVAQCEGGLIPLDPGAPRVGEFASTSPFKPVETAVLTEDDGSVIDVFVFYTPTVRRIAGGHTLMRAIVDLDVAWTNEAYRASGVRQRVNLVGLAEIADFPADEEFPLHRLTYRIADVQAIRDAYAADLVTLKLWKSGGLAWLSPLHPRAEHLGFSIVGLYGPGTFAHELGHNMGLRHPRNGANPDVENTPYPYSHGYALPGLPLWDPDTGIRNATVMDNQGGPGLQRFSDPLAEYRGIRMGVPGDEPSSHIDGPADAVRSLANTRMAIARFRASETRCDYRLSARSSIVPASGGTFTIQVETNDGCPWVVTTHDSAVVLRSGSGGSGNGQVTYRIEPNDGWERTVALRIAGEMHPVRQASDRVPKPVCDRSVAALEAITEVLGKPCEDVDTHDLKRIPRLEVKAEAVPAVGDFDGMTNLGELSLDWSEEAPLPASTLDGLVNVVELSLTGAGVESGALEPLVNLSKLQLNGGENVGEETFAGLSKLQTLRLLRYDLASLPMGAFSSLRQLTTLRIEKSKIGRIERGAFDGLDEIKDLYVIHGQIGSVEPGAFRGLPRLDVLQMGHNHLTRLAAGTFDGLAGLRWLNLENNELSELDPDTFRGLSSLRYLYLHGNRLRTLPKGVFDELPTLQWRLDLSDNGLEFLEPGTFDQLGNLYALMLGQNELGELAPDTFRGLGNLIVLDLSGNGLRELNPGVFQTVHELGELRLSRNHLTRLPEGIFAGLAGLTSVTLRDNPGTPFPFVVDLARAARSASGVEAVALQIDQGAPFAMTAGLSVEGGRATSAEAGLLAGQLLGDGVLVAPHGESVVRVALATVPENPTTLGCEDVNARDYGRLKPCYPGVRLVAGEPLWLYGIPDRTLSADRAETISLTSIFGVFFNAAELSFTVTSSDLGTVAADLADDVLTLTPVAPGTAIVTVVASDGRSQVSRQFVVTVPEIPRSQWRGWRLRLLMERGTKAALGG